MRLHDLLTRISNDPVKYALRLVFLLGVLLLVVLLFVPKAEATSLESDRAGRAASPALQR